MGCIFNEKIAVPWIVHECIVHGKSQHPWLKKKKKRRRRENRDAKTQETRNPNRTLIYHGMIGAFESFRFYSQFIGFFFLNYLI